MRRAVESSLGPDMYVVPAVVASRTAGRAPVLVKGQGDRVGDAQAATPEQM
jgi:hypothetical protein